MSITKWLNKGMFSSYFSEKEEDHIYLAGWEVDFNGNEQCQKFIETQVIDKKTANKIYSSIELVFKDDKIIKAYDYDEGVKSERKLKQHEFEFMFQKLEPNKIHNLNRVSKSESYLGGEIPNDFTIPKFEFNLPFQYLGKCSKSNKGFNWLPFDLHLVAPIYSNFERLFIDYSNPLNPEVLNLEELERSNNSINDLKPNSEIVYEQVFINTKKSNNFNGLGHTGVPNWIQYPAIPSCPKTKKTMKFLCQLSAYDGNVIKTKRMTVDLKNKPNNRYYENMNFWADGDLYIFFSSESKVACYFIQNT